MRSLLFSLCLAVSDCASVSPDPQEAEVRTAAETLLSSWRDADPAGAERVLHPDFRLTTLQGEGAERRVYAVPRSGLIEAARDLAANDWDDQLRDVEVRVDSNGLATLWARYSFFVDQGQPSHCGHVSMQFYRTAEGWKIISFADSHNNLNGRPESEVCP